MTVIDLQLGIQEAIAIDTPPERVWGVFSNLDRWPAWNPVCSQAQQVSGQPWSIGSRFRVTIKPWWAEMTVTPTVAESSPPDKVTWVVHPAGFWAEHYFRFEPQGNGTLVVTHGDFGGPLRVLLPLVAPSWQVRRMFRHWLEALKTEAEKVA